jgi:hypothetical protein
MRYWQNDDGTPPWLGVNLCADTVCLRLRGTVEGRVVSRQSREKGGARLVLRATVQQQPDRERCTVRHERNGCRPSYVSIRDDCARDEPAEQTICSSANTRPRSWTRSAIRRSAHRSLVRRCQSIGFRARRPHSCPTGGSSLGKLTPWATTTTLPLSRANVVRIFL